MAKKITDLTALSETPAENDLFIVRDTSTGIDKSVTKLLLTGATNAEVATLDGITAGTGTIKEQLDKKAKLGVNSDITSLTGLDDNSIPRSKIANLDGNKNVLIDGGFTINQRVYVSAATLSAGVYGHDGWKAGASGGDYSFTQLDSNTQITIASGKTLIQVIGSMDVVGGTYTLSWEGTAQGRYAVDSDTPAGTYADSPIAITGQTAGTTMSVEFDDGTLGKVQLESGTPATDFEYRHSAIEKYLCEGYYEKSYDLTVAPGTSTALGSRGFVAPGTGTRQISNTFKTRKNGTPTASFYSTTGASGKIRDLTTSADLTQVPDQIGESGIPQGNANTLVDQRQYQYHFVAKVEL